MSPPLQQIQTSPTLPAAADVVVIGGGIVGVFAAYYLAPARSVSCLGREGENRRRAVEPQLGLVPAAES